MDKKELIIKEFAPFELSDADMQNAINQAKILTFNKGEILYKDKVLVMDFCLFLAELCELLCFLQIIKKLRFLN